MTELALFVHRTAAADTFALDTIFNRAPNAWQPSNSNGLALNENVALQALPPPVRALHADDPAELLEFAVACFKDGPVAIATLVEIRGGAARALGSHVVISADGRFGGYVSGGCVEAAVASEALIAMREGCDRTAMFGDGSPFFDIVLPCGGGITVAIHLLHKIDEIERVLERLRRRQSTGLRYSPARQSLISVEPLGRAGWAGDDFLIVYRPRTRLVISGRTIEAQTVARLAECSGYDIIVLESVKDQCRLRDAIDPFTAIVLLHHDLDQEVPVLETAIRASAFYIGALGSTRTHRKRVDRLQRLGYSEVDLARIKAPIGLFGPTRDAASLALSVLADVAAARLATFG